MLLGPLRYIQYITADSPRSDIKAKLPLRLLESKAMSLAHIGRLYASMMHVGSRVTCQNGLCLAVGSSQMVLVTNFTSKSTIVSQPVHSEVPLYVIH